MSPLTVLDNNKEEEKGTKTQVKKEKSQEDKLPFKKEEVNILGPWAHQTATKSSVPWSLGSDELRTAMSDAVFSKPQFLIHWMVLTPSISELNVSVGGCFKKMRMNRKFWGLFPYVNTISRCKSSYFPKDLFISIDLFMREKGTWWQRLNFGTSRSRIQCLLHCTIANYFSYRGSQLRKKMAWKSTALVHLSCFLLL